MTTRQIQDLLDFLGYGPVDNDETIGPITQEAVKTFQRCEGLADDGIPGPLTEAQLLNAVAARRYYKAGTTENSGTVCEKTGTFWESLKHFKREEMRCPCGKCGGFPVEPAEKLMRTLDADIWEHFQAPITIVPLPPNNPHAGGSGVRCQAYNDSLRGSVPNSRHVQGKAADIIVRGFSGSAVKAYCDSLVKVGKLRYCYVIGGGNSVHVDIL